MKTVLTAIVPAGNFGLVKKSLGKLAKNKSGINSRRVGIATSIIGIKISPSKFFVNKKIRAYNHSYPDEYEYDPKSGKRLWVENPEPIPDADGNFQKNNTENKYLLHRYKGWQAFAILDDNDSQILGAGSCSDGATSFLQLSKLSDMKDDLKNSLMPLGLWDQNKFGLYTAFSIF
jgi:hypothetical protein